MNRGEDDERVSVTLEEGERRDSQQATRRRRDEAACFWRVKSRDLWLVPGYMCVHVETRGLGDAGFPKEESKT